ncbi:molybdenum cofactor biosynthesis protein A [Aeromicrobium marinum DSM 15272]|uniref:GTP 3',8-cyclase n=1 Tax=Aeromicrobium marinum DSM 15272 TaxID=585531 RepID=E2SA09_9ACTN|nr:GTP 3',8-cyclase MoaA [Aeromicrobium marinum]EFQ84083.1 molybdenum cofactor biosynthesis protein A [Aeromicrobium marinum DSM 15272]
MHLVDLHGRVATDLRVSLTDRCNLRCQYCMPAEGLDWMPTEETLTDDELNRLIAIAVERLGVTDVRFTGGEPLLRRSLPSIIAATAALPSRPRTAITSNGLGLKHTARALADAGLNRVNISLDTIDAAIFEQITRRNRLHDVMAGLEAAREAGLSPVKVNAVLLRDVNDHGAADLLRWCMENDYALRFIEQMPLDAQHGWSRAAMVTADETLAMLSKEFDLQPLDGRGSAPAELFSVDGGPHSVGIIGSVTRPFCGDCNRVRLTADGQVRNCLFARDESDLRAAMRGGADDEQLAQAWITAMAGKLPGHGIDDPSFLQPTRPMSAIGG